MLSDLAAGLVTLVVLALYASGKLQVWQLCLAGFLAGSFQAFEYPAYAVQLYQDAFGDIPSWQRR